MTDTTRAVAGEAIPPAPSTSSPKAKQTQPVPPISLHPAPERTDTDGRMPSSSVRSGGLPAGERERIAKGLAEFLEEFPPHGVLRGSHRAERDEVSQ